MEYLFNLIINIFFLLTSTLAVNSTFAKNTNSLSRENPIGEPFVELSEVDSSNNYAIGQVQAHLAGHGATWVTSHQKAGKGQRGKVWIDEPGQNIILSSIIQPKDLSIGNQFILSAIVALACYDFIHYYAGNETKIKWPNDLYWKDRKAGGILIENILQGNDWKYSIIGIGININQTLFPSNLYNPISLKQITGKTYNVISLAKKLCMCLEERWQQLKAKTGDELINEYSLVLYKAGERVNLKKANTFFNAVIKGVNIKGELIIDTGIETAVGYGTIEWVKD